MLAVPARPPSAEPESSPRPATWDSGARLGRFPGNSPLWGTERAESTGLEPPFVPNVPESADLPSRPPAVVLGATSRLHWVTLRQDSRLLCVCVSSSGLRAAPGERELMWPCPGRPLSTCTVPA